MNRDAHVAASRHYEVDLTVRETYTVVVEAANAKEASHVARYVGGELDTWEHGDRTITGVKAVRRAAT
jgi:hypothetical protein